MPVISCGSILRRRLVMTRRVTGPALVLSPAAYNSKTSLMICCPVTTQIKNYPFEVLIGGDPPSAVLADQVKSLDWRRRNVKPKGQVLPKQLAEVLAKIYALIG
jgi:mRNA interferase MazF